MSVSTSPNINNGLRSPVLTQPNSSQSAINNANQQILQNKLVSKTGGKRRRKRQRQITMRKKKGRRTRTRRRRLNRIKGGASIPISTIPNRTGGVDTTGGTQMNIAKQQNMSHVQNQSQSGLSLQKAGSRNTRKRRK